MVVGGGVKMFPIRGNFACSIVRGARIKSLAAATAAGARGAAPR